MLDKLSELGKNYMNGSLQEANFRLRVAQVMLNEIADNDEIAAVAQLLQDEPYYS